MNKPTEYPKVHRVIDGIQQRITAYACTLSYEDLPADVIHAVKTRVIDTLGALLSGFYGAPCIISRGVAARCPIFLVQAFWARA